MKCLISRTYGPLQTIGSLYVLEGEKLIYRCKTIELPENGNQKNCSCIPSGEYKVTKIFSPKHGKCFEVHDVPERSAILIHKGNFASGDKKDTRGCILVGNCFEDINEDGNLDVVGSTDTLNKLLGVLSNEFTLFII